ncbi:hypothetical protein [Deinococcus pimensis]|uniref:hypothetical protein n=1 Tax=Deinococcus pimensis TaxID=309888 RepID=UPI00047F3899|nr:hypothetical protein [Deinococcus pimensis]
MLPRGQSPFLTLVIGLVVALLVEGILGGVVTRVLVDLPAAARWAVSLIVVAGAVLTVVRTRWLSGVTRLNLPQLIATTVLVLLALRLLEGRVQEAPQPWGLLVALAAGAGVGYGLWRAPGPRAARQWMAVLFGVVMFATLYW